MHINLENTSSIIKKKKLLYFINIISSRLVGKKKTKFAATHEIYNLYKKIRIEKNVKPSLYLNTFFDKATLRLALRDYVAGAKKTLIPKPVTKAKARLALVKKFIDVYIQGRPELTIYDKMFHEMQDFFDNKGQTYTNKVESYLISRQNIRQGRYVYKRKKLKKEKNNTYNNVIKKKSI